MYFIQKVRVRSIQHYELYTHIFNIRYIMVLKNNLFKFAVLICIKYQPL